MTAIFALIENTEKMRKYLFWYLMIIPALLLLWIALGAANSQMDFQAALKIPFFTVAFLNACLSLLLGGTLKFAGAENERTERAYALYLTILLVIIGNLPGAILSFFLFRSLRFGNQGRQKRPTVLGRQLAFQVAEAQGAEEEEAQNRAGQVTDDNQQNGQVQRTNAPNEPTPCT